MQHCAIREQITPKGDGKQYISYSVKFILTNIREQITPKGDGKLLSSLFHKRFRF